jgi:hypothetical protein
MAQREPERLPLDAHDDQAEPGPGVEPAVHQLQLGGVRLDEYRRQRCAEAAAAGV